MFEPQNHEPMRQRPAFCEQGCRPWRHGESTLSSRLTPECVADARVKPKDRRAVAPSAFERPFPIAPDPVIIGFMQNIVEAPAVGRFGRVVDRLPPASYFVVSAVFHYLGPSLAVLLFVHVEAIGVAWLRIGSAAVVFAIWRRPWRIWLAASRSQRLVLFALGAVLALMNSLFYLAVERLPLATVGAVEFLGIVVLAALGARTRRNIAALIVAVTGVAVLTNVRRRVSRGDSCSPSPTACASSGT